MQLEFDPAKFSATPEGAECLHAPFPFLCAPAHLSSDYVHTDT